MGSNKDTIRSQLIQLIKLQQFNGNLVPTTLDNIEGMETSIILELLQKVVKGENFRTQQNLWINKKVAEYQAEMTSFLLDNLKFSDEVSVRDPNDPNYYVLKLNELAEQNLQFIEYQLKPENHSVDLKIVLSDLSQNNNDYIPRMIDWNINENINTNVSGHDFVLSQIFYTLFKSPDYSKLDQAAILIDVDDLPSDYIEVEGLGNNYLRLSIAFPSRLDHETPVKDIILADDEDLSMIQQIMKQEDGYFFMTSDNDNRKVKFELIFKQIE